MTSPVFVFSAGWRSGSTMLQRVITASGQVLVWGEAGGALDRLADALACYEQMLGPGGTRFKHGFGGNGSQEYEDFVAAGNEGVHKWIACMNAPRGLFIGAMRKFFNAVYEEPALKLGYAAWGVKEVQSGLDAASFLRELYPEGRFVFLVRSPIACLTSIKRHDWLDRPNDPHALEHYAGHWVRLAREFRKADFGMLVRYEDLVSSRESQNKLAAYLEIDSLTQQFSESRHVDWQKSHNEALSFFERRRLARLVQHEVKEHGYDG